MLKTLYSYIKKSIIALSIVLTLLFGLVYIILNIFELVFRQWVIYFTLSILIVLFIIGICQIISKIKQRTVRITVSVIFILSILIATPFAYLLFTFSYQVEHFVVKNDIKLIAYVNGFTNTYVEYYDYENAFVRGKKLRLYEAYGNGSFNPISGTQGNDYKIENYTWYDDNGNPIK